MNGFKCYFKYIIYVYVYSSPTQDLICSLSNKNSKGDVYLI